jgi:hypothetical protein
MVQATYRGHQTRRSSVTAAKLRTEPREIVIMRWQTLVGKALALKLSDGMNWAALSSSLKAGYVPVSDEAIEAMMSKQTCFSYQSICADARQSRLQPMSIETLAGQAERRRGSVIINAGTHHDEVVAQAGEQPEAPRVEHHPSRFRLKQSPRPVLPPIDSSSRFVSNPVSIPCSNTGERVELTVEDGLGRTMNRFNGASPAKPALTVDRMHEISARMHRYAEQRILAASAAEETRRCLRPSPCRARRTPAC